MKWTVGICENDIFGPLSIICWWLSPVRLPSIRTPPGNVLVNSTCESIIQSCWLCWAVCDTWPSVIWTVCQARNLCGLRTWLNQSVTNISYILVANYCQKIFLCIKFIQKQCCINQLKINVANIWRQTTVSSSSHISSQSPSSDHYLSVM